MLQPTPILECKWKSIEMYFTIGLSKTQNQHDSIMVVMAKVSNVSHFIPAKSTYKEIDIVDIFIKGIFSYMTFQRWSFLTKMRSLHKIS